MSDPLQPSSNSNESSADLQAEVARLRAELEEVTKRRSGEARSHDSDRKQFEQTIAELRKQVEETPLRIAQALGMQQPPADPLDAVHTRLNDLASELESEKKSRRAAEAAVRLTTLEMRKTQLLPPELAAFADYIPTHEDADKQAQAIAAFGEKLAQVTKKSVPSAVPNTPLASPPGNGSTQDINVLRENYFRAIASGQDADIKKAGDVYYDALQQQQQ